MGYNWRRISNCDYDVGYDQIEVMDYGVALVSKEDDEEWEVDKTTTASVFSLECTAVTERKYLLINAAGGAIAGRAITAVAIHPKSI